MEYHGFLNELADQRPTFYSESLQKDPYGVAQALLRWRDELIEIGWTVRAPLRLLWAPRDPRALLEFLTHAVCPVSSHLR